MKIYNIILNLIEKPCSIKHVSHDKKLGKRGAFPVEDVFCFTRQVKSFYGRSTILKVSSRTRKPRKIDVGSPAQLPRRQHNAAFLMLRQTQQLGTKAALKDFWKSFKHYMDRIKNGDYTRDCL